MIRVVRAARTSICSERPSVCGAASTEIVALRWTYFSNDGRWYYFQLCSQIYLT